MGGRLAKCWQSDRAVRQNHRNFGLCPGERQPKPFFARKQGAERQDIKDADQSGIVEPGGLGAPGGRS